MIASLHGRPVPRGFWLVKLERIEMNTFALITAEALKAALNQQNTVVLDCSWYLPTMNRDAEAEYRAGRIPGAQRFDFDKNFALPGTDLPHMLPTPEAFESGVRALGISANTLVVCYDGAGIFAAPRAWWMFKVMGHQKVVVLNGGLPAWKDAGGALESDPAPAVQVTPGDFIARLDKERLADAKAVLGALAAADNVVLDARSPGRFEGREPEPRAGLRPGHMPGARNLPFDQVLENGHYKNVDALRALYAARGAKVGQRVIVSCGSGVTASVLALGAEAAGLGPVTVYDGSWSEWGQESRPEWPVVQGAEAGT